MKRLKQSNESELADIFTIDIDKIRQLQLILSQDLKRQVELEEANEIGKHLIRFYERLAGNLRIVKGGLKNRDRL